MPNPDPSQQQQDVIDFPSAPDAAQRARDQATAYNSVFAPHPMVLTYPDGSKETIEIPPHPNLRMLDDERQEAYEELMFEVESYDHEDDTHIPETRVIDADGKQTGDVIPARTIKGDLKVPYRKGGKLIKPPHSVRVVQVALGSDVYAKLRRAKRSAADVWRIWNQQGLDLAVRQEVDSKSNGSPSPVGSVAG